jgi:DNA-binding transcriptional ArsR family regulator
LTIINNDNIIIIDNNILQEIKMDNSLLSCILNPIRMRIIQSLARNKKMTVQQIAQELPEVPQATLYRHLNKLLEAKAIMVVQENKIRGVIEKVYAISTNPYETATKDLDEKGKGETLKLFYNYLMSLLGDFEGYLQADNIDLIRDGVSFRSAALYLSDEEYAEFFKDIIHAFDKVINNGPAPGRRLRKVSTISMPSLEE